MKVRLEVFQSNAVQGNTVVLQASEIEDARLQSYELGYAAGWEDAIAATADETGQLTTELANNLQQLAFTFHEARSQVIRNIQPVLTELATRLLPELAREVIAPVVLETLMPLIDDATDQPIVLTLNPASVPAVERLLSQAAGLPVRIHEEPSLGQGQVYLALGDREYRVELDEAVKTIIQAVRNFFECSEKDDANGQTK